MTRLSTVAKSMEKTERNGSMKLSPNFKRKTPPSLCLTSLMETKSFPKVMPVVSTSATRLTEKTFWEEMLMSKSPCTQLWEF